jgi:hypothetical protein
LDQSDEHEAMLLVADHFDGFEGFVTVDPGQHGEV